MRHVALVMLLLSLGCGDAKLPVQPTPLPVAPTQQEFSLSGEIYDIARRPLDGARAEVTNGLRAGTVTTTDDAGRFSMPGTFTGVVAVTASKDGYVSATRTFTQASRPVFSLEPIGPSANIAGTYTLTLTTDGDCTNLPHEARTRNYTATIVPGERSSSFQARLSDARFFSKCLAGGQVPESCDRNQFGIGMVGDYAGMYVGIIEQLSETTYLIVDAGGGAVFGPTGTTVPLHGYLVYCLSEPYLIDQGTWSCRGSDRVQCDSENHQLTLVRR